MAERKLRVVGNARQWQIEFGAMGNYHQDAGVIQVLFDHAKHFKRHNRELKFLRTRLGRWTATSA